MLSFSEFLTACPSEDGLRYPISCSQCWIFGEAFSCVVFDNEDPDCLVRVFFSVMRFELCLLIGGFHAFPNFLSETALRLAFFTDFGDRGNASEAWKKNKSIKLKIKIEEHLRLRKQQVKYYMLQL